jgi:DsbC/DsbD-like thiol-disulfide interchange protein
MRRNRDSRNRGDRNRGVAHFLPVFAVAGLIAAAYSTAAHAADASDWDEDLQTAARLIAARQGVGVAAHVLRAGIEIRLKPGWKTYWRYPGDSGIPPVIDFSASRNVKIVTVLFPAPTRFPDGAGGSSIGYVNDVVFPVHVVVQDATKPTVLRLKLNYAACEKLCIPAEAELELVLTGKASALEQAVAAAEARVPKSAAIGEDGPLAIRAVQREGGAGKPRMLVDVAAPAGAEVLLFAEGPTKQWALPLPEPVDGAPAGLRRFAFALDGLPPGAKAAGATLRLTAVAGEAAIEVAFPLD